MSREGKGRAGEGREGKGQGREEAGAVNSRRLTSSLTPIPICLETRKERDSPLSRYILFRKFTSREFFVSRIPANGSWKYILTIKTRQIEYFSSSLFVFCFFLLRFDTETELRMKIGACEKCFNAFSII